jgi:hypothetical protein
MEVGWHQIKVINDRKNTTSIINGFVLDMCHLEIESVHSVLRRMLGYPRVSVSVSGVLSK